MGRPAGADGSRLEGTPVRSAVVTPTEPMHMPPFFQRAAPASLMDGADWSGAYLEATTLAPADAQTAKRYSAVHDALGALQRQRVTEILQCVAHLTKAQQELEGVTHALAREVPALRLDQALKHVGEVELMLGAMARATKQLHALKAQLLARAAASAVSKAVYKQQHALETAAREVQSPSKRLAADASLRGIPRGALRLSHLS